MPTEAMLTSVLNTCKYFRVLIKKGIIPTTKKVIKHRLYLHTACMCRLSPDNDGLTNYNIWAAAVTEVEIDVLTGEMYVVRCDLITDAGHSVSPLVSMNGNLRK